MQQTSPAGVNAANRQNQPPTPLNECVRLDAYGLGAALSEQLTERDDRQPKGVCDATLGQVSQLSPARVFSLVNVEVDFVHHKLSTLGCSHLLDNGGHCGRCARVVTGLGAVEPEGDVVVVGRSVEVPVDCHILS